ncbi:Mss4-like protein [Microdochium bolleyi]|uniref:Mss4-like protein n=1 Tax=Microdochium bolleyi TaxID=196109 RepID=A0A136J6I8_9PEZI|nr:Mss4-like protein [Microdochium bolleyi]
MSSINDLPTPSFVTGSCLCRALSYRIDFPESHNFEESSGTCQCTQCRKNVSHLFFMYYKVPKSGFRWFTSDSTTSNADLVDFSTSPKALKHFQASKGHSRGFCTECGSMMYWSRDAGPNVSVAIGTVDPLYLFGEGAGGDGEARDVPKGGYGLVLASGGGGHEWIQNEIPGVTDKLSILGFVRGERCVSEEE